MRSFFSLILICGLPIASASTTSVTLHTSPLIVDHEWTEHAGPWSVPGLLTRLGGSTISASSILNGWLQTWERDQLIGSDPVLGRRMGPFLRFWPRDSLGRLDLNRAPFRLTAIVFRPDLIDRDKPAGEGRFIFGLYDPQTLLPIEFYWIFEYRLPTDVWSPQEWATRIRALEGTMHAPDYPNALRHLTDHFTQSLAQIRTNDFLTSATWEFREFHWNGSAIESAQTVNTPSMQEVTSPSTNLSEWIQSQMPLVLDGTAKLPLSMTGGANQTSDERFLWFDQSSVPPPVRQAFSKLTCNGCHSGATDTRFTHVSNRLVGQPARLSSFLQEDLPNRLRALEQLEHPVSTDQEIGRRGRRVH